MPDLCPSSVRARRLVSLFRPLAGIALRALAPLLAAALVCVFPAWAEDGKREPWQALIEEHQTTPERLIAVDKSRQQLSLFERRSPLKLTRLFVCTTGQSTGDKEREGDLKTPEGVYFVVQRIGSGLEFLKYGTEAYTLNYPNPVDRLRKKTGYGIWIHGRGEPLAPLQTQGCVSMNNEDLASIGSVLQPGTPVALTESFALSQGNNSQDAAAISLLERKTQAWAKAWGQRSTSMFDFYDKQAYGLAQGESFSRFQAQKERLFKQLPWINNAIRDIRVLRGPGYWVTWFYQDYKAPNLSTSGVRRLYWVPDAKGEFKIVGMEWAPGMSSGTLLASAEPALPPIEAQPRTEEQILPRPGAGGTEPAQTGRSADSSAGAALVAQAGNAPAGSSQSLPPAGGDSGGLTASAASRVDAPAAEKRAFADHVEDPRLGKMAEPPQAARLMAERRAKAARAEASAPASSPASAPVASSGPAPASAAQQGLTLPPALPSQGLAASGRPGGARDSAPVAPAPAAPGLTAPAEAASVPASSASVPAAPDQGGAGKSGESALLASAPPPSRLPAESGPAAPNQKDGGQSQDRTGKEGPADAPLGAGLPASGGSPDIEAGPAGGIAELSGGGSGKAAKTPAADASPSAEDIAGLLSSRTEAWRAAWESGNLDDYMAFYAPQAKQGSRGSAEAIRKHKLGLWDKAAPASLTLEDMRINVQGSTVTVAMRQEYADSNGGGDRGLKTLIFENINGQWLITQEKWSALPDETGH